MFLKYTAIVASTLSVAFAQSPTAGEALDAELGKLNTGQAALDVRLKDAETRLDEIEKALAAPVDPNPAPTPDPQPEPDPAPIAGVDYPYTVTLFARNTGAKFVAPIGANDYEFVINDRDAASFDIQLSDDRGANVVAAASIALDGKTYALLQPTYITGNGALALPVGAYPVDIKDSDGARAMTARITVNQSTGGNPPAPPTPGLPPVNAPANGLETAAGIWFGDDNHPTTLWINRFAQNDCTWYRDNPLNNRSNPLADTEMDKDCWPLPSALSGGRVISPRFFGSVFKTQQAGHWIVEVTNGAIDVLNIPSNRQISKTPTRYEFEYRANDGFFPAVELTAIQPGVRVVMYRKQDETDYLAGKIVPSDLVNELASYQWVRAMDLMQTNDNCSQNVNQLTQMSAAFWGSKCRDISPTQGVPLEALFRLGVEANVNIWLNAPTFMGGFPLDIAAQGGLQARINAVRATVQADPSSVINPTAWYDYANAVLDAMEAAGYKGRVNVAWSNEIWNATSFRLNNAFAGEIGKSVLGVTKNDSTQRRRRAVGLMLAQIAVAFEKAQSDRGTNFDITYVNETWTPVVPATTYTLTEMQRQVTAMGGDWNTIRAKVGTAPASYWGGDDWKPFCDASGNLVGPSGGKYCNVNHFENYRSLAEWQAALGDGSDDAVNAAEAQAFADWFIAQPANVQGSPAWVADKLRSHDIEAKRLGTLGVIGTYEGDAHLLRFQAFKVPWSRGFYETLMWGPEGQRILDDMHQRILNDNDPATGKPRYSSMNLADYGVTVDSGRDSWHNGAIGDNNARKAYWRALGKGK